MPDNSGAVSLEDLPQEAQEALGRMADETDTQPDPEFPTKKVHTAFLVFVNDDGSTEVMAFEDDGVEVRVTPTPDLIRGAATNIIQALNSQETAMVTLGRQMAQAQAMAQQVEAQRLRENLKL